MIKTRSCLLIAATTWALAATSAGADAGRRVSIRPSRPSVHARITATIDVGNPLASGWHWVYTLEGNPSRSSCASFVQETSHRRGAARKPLSFTFAFDDDILLESGDILAPAQQWCPGKALILIEKDRNSDKDDKHGATVGTASFRIYS